MIYFLITTSLCNLTPIRQFQYFRGILSFQIYINRLPLRSEDYKIIVIENNGNDHSFLDQIAPNVFYTKNNFLPTQNKGVKEWQDIMDCIQHYSIQDDDFIVKITGRYFLAENSPFMEVIQTMSASQYDAVILYGSYNQPQKLKMRDCVTGLIGMRCRHVKLIKKPNENECVEWLWADVTLSMPEDKVCSLNSLGLYLAVGSDNNNYNII